MYHDGTGLYLHVGTYIRHMRSTVKRVFWLFEFFLSILSRSCVSSTTSTQAQKRAVEADAPLTPSRVQARTKQPRPSAPAASADVGGRLSTSSSAPPPPPPKPKTYSCLCGNNALSSSGVGQGPNMHTSSGYASRGQPQRSAAWLRETA